MRLLTVIAAVGLLSCAASVFCTNEETSARNWVVGPQSLADIGIREPSDIESVLIRYYQSDSAYLLTYKDTPELVTRLRQAVYELGPYSVPCADGTANILLFKAKDGQAALLPFWCEPSSKEGDPDKCFICGSARMRSYSLDVLLEEITRSPKARELGGQVAGYKVREVEITLPQKRTVRIPASSAHARDVLQKAKTIVDWLDLRSVLACRPGGVDLIQAQRKYVSVTLLLEERIQVRIYEMVDDAKARPKEYNEPGGFCFGIQPRDIWCDALVVMDYGNYIPPVVLIRDRMGDYYLYDQLTRRAQEREGVEKYALPGPPLSNKAYYKSPKDLYVELRTLAEKAYRFGTPQSY